MSSCICSIFQLAIHGRDRGNQRMKRAAERNAVSRRELEIARAYAAGGSYREIAERLFISPSTVRTHLSTIYRKLGVSSKIELAKALQDVNRRHTTILAADLAGYSRLMAADAEGVIARLKAARQEIIDPEIEKGGGRILKTTGDGLLIEFASAESAVRAALVVQRTMAERGSGPEEGRLRFRVGINIGDIVVDRDNVLGDGMNVAARLETLASPGGICISRAVHEHIKGQPDIECTELGPQYVRNLAGPIEVWRVETGVAIPYTRPLADRDTASVAILPFDNLSRDPDQDFLADGLVEDITTELSRFRWLFIIARNSTLAYKGSPKDVRQIARELGVRYVVEGSVRRVGNRLRVNTQLIDAETGSHVWANRWDRVIEDLFDLQDEMTTAIVSGLEPELGAHERRLARRKPTEQLNAWELCQRGYGEYLTFTAEGFQKSEKLLEAARQADPGFELPYEFAARLYYMSVLSGRAEDRQGVILKGLELAQTALRLNERSDMAHQGLGMLLALTGRHEDAMAMLNRGLALNGNNAHLYNVRAFCRLIGPNPDPKLVIEDEKAALRLSPMDVSAAYMHFVTGLALLYQDASDPGGHALAAFEASCRFQNADWYCFLLLAISLIRHGQIERAKQYVHESLRLRPSLTSKSLVEAWPFPAWYQLWRKLRDDAVHQLIRLGIPDGTSAQSRPESPAL